MKDRPSASTLGNAASPGGVSPDELERVARQFALAGELCEAAPQGRGHINDTYRVSLAAGGTVRRYILQRLNRHVFPDIPRLMDNIARVTAHLRRRLVGEPGADPGRDTLTVIPTRDGRAFWEGEDGRCWRAYPFIEGIRVVQTPDSPSPAREAGRAFGRFLRLLRDLPPPRLHETIPGFHHTPGRFAALVNMIDRDPLNRATGARDEIAFALSREVLAGELARREAAGVLPEWVTHNDTKINNVLLDEATGRGLAVIDLDTVMPGRVAYDFGDMVRTFTCSGAEDDSNPAAIAFRPAYFEALARGFTDEVGAFLTPAEWSALEPSGRVITFEIGIRFLADHLAGDTYFKTARPGHNLDRARVQFARLRALEAAAGGAAALLDRCRAAVRKGGDQ